MALVYQQYMRDCAEDGDATERFFELANSDLFRYATTSGAEVEILQDRKTQAHTGGIVWETAFMLATYLEKTGISASTKDPNPTVLELGAGCGLLGIVLATSRCRVMLTEQPEALGNLQQNVKRNAAAFNKARAMVPTVMQLRWGCREDMDAVSESSLCPFDLIVGTDVVYQSDFVEPMLSTMHAMADGRTVVWLCLQERCAAAHQRLLETAQNYFEEFAVLDTAGLHGFEHGDELECKLYRLSSRRSVPTMSS